MRILLFNIKKIRNICISNLDSNVKDQDLIDLFQPFGEVVFAEIQIDVFTGASRGFGYVEMTNEDNALRAIVTLNQYALHGLTVSVSP